MNPMTCSRCRFKMVEKKRSYHKRRKWTCTKCGAVRMQDQKPRMARASRGGEA